MDKFGRDELERFLRAVDRNVQHPVRLDLLGEAVAILKFGSRTGTGDIDLFTDCTPITDAIKVAGRETGLNVPLSIVGVYDAPYGYEGRMERIDVPGLRNLEIYAPEKHDWALMKTMRLLRKDLDDIVEVHHEIGLDKDVLLDRFLNEMTHVSGRPKEKIADFLDVMQALYGEVERERARKAITDHRGWQQKLEETKELG